MTKEELIKAIVADKLLKDYEKQIREDAFKDCKLPNGDYCWQRCVAVEHCQECKCLGNGDINYFGGEF